MKKIFPIFIGLLMVGSSTWAYGSEACLKCHKGKEVLAEKIKKSGANSEAELVDFLKNKSSKKAIHASLKEEEIKEAFSKNSSKTTSEKTLQETAKTKKKTKVSKSSKSNSNATKKSESKESSSVKEEIKGTTKSKKKVEGC